MKAKKKPNDVMTPDDLGVDVTPRLEIVSVEAPQGRERGVIVANAAELVERLRSEAKVI